MKYIDVIGIGAINYDYMFHCKNQILEIPLLMVDEKTKEDLKQKLKMKLKNCIEVVKNLLHK